MVRVVIAEKPSVAGDIAQALGDMQQRQGWYESEEWQVTWAVGHLLELLTPEEYSDDWKRWTMRALPILPEAFRSKPSGNRKQLNTVLKLVRGRGVTEVINACDAAREGERIFQEIYRHAGVNVPYRRLWLQSLTRGAIKQAFDELRDGDAMHPLRDAADCRAEADWLIGMNGTRACTIRLRSRKRQRREPPWSVGRVQTATLAMVVDRELEVLGHVPAPYWELKVEVAAADERWEAQWQRRDHRKDEERPEWKPERIFEADERAAVEAVLAAPGDATVAETRKPREQRPPLLFDLTELQKAANRRFSWTATRTLRTAQTLYEGHKAITYPRTDSRYLPQSMRGHVDQTVEALTGVADLATHARRLQEQGLSNAGRNFNNKRVRDHFAIIPTGRLPGGLKRDEARLFDLVCRQFLAAFHPTAKWEHAQRTATKRDHDFVARQRRLVEVGWRALFPPKVEHAEWRLLPEPVPGTLDGPRFEEALTKPRRRLTEAALLGRMEGAGKQVDDEELREALEATQGLGTPATRADTIETLLARDYAARTREGLRATFRGIRLVDTLRRVPVEWLVTPALTGEMEHHLRQVQEGELARADYMEEIIGNTRELVARLDGFKAADLYADEPPLGDCPSCGKAVAETSYNYNCDGCEFVIWKEITGRYIDRPTAERLLRHGHIEELHGFFDRKEREYSAGIALRAGRVEVQQPGDEIAAQDVDEAPLGDCPLCGGTVRETATHYRCDSDDCKLDVPRIVKDRPLARSEAQQLLRDSRTELLEGFTSRYGKPYAAHLTLRKNGRLGWEFPPREADPTLPKYAVEAGTVAECQVHKVPVEETETHYRAVENDAGCRIEIPRSLSKRELRREEAALLIANGEAGPWEDFISKKGNPFTATLYLKRNERVGYRFPKRK